MGEQGTTYACSFCGKGEEQVQVLIAGRGEVYICDDCVLLCYEIVITTLPKAPPPAAGQKQE